MGMFARHRRGRPARAKGFTQAAALFASLALIGAATVATAAVALAEESGASDKVITSVKAPFVTPPTCQSDGLLRVPSQEHILYTTDPALTGEATATAGVTYTITATVKGGAWKIATGVTTAWTLTPLPRLSEEECAEADPVDLCSDLPGVQETIPPGYVPNADGSCSLKAADEGELKPVVEVAATCGRADWTVTNPNLREEGETDSQGGKPIHFYVIIDTVKSAPVVLLPQQSASGFKVFDLGSGDHTVTVNAGNGRAGAGSGSGGESATSGHSGGSGEEGHGPAVTKTVTVSTDCGTFTPPASSVVGPARPTATIVVASCSAATVNLFNYTDLTTDPPADFTVTANGAVWKTATLPGGETTSLPYPRPAGVEKAIHLEVLSGEKVLATGDLAVCADVEGVVIPGAAPATVEATVVAVDTATLPETGAGSSASIALAGAGMLVLGGLLVAWSLRRPLEEPAR